MSNLTPEVFPTAKGVLTPKGALNQQFTIAKAEIEALQSGEGLSFTGEPVTSDTITPESRLLIHTAGVTSAIEMTEFLKVVAKGRPFYSSADAGIVQDGSINNSPMLNSFMDTISAIGGGTIIIESKEGQTLHFDEDVMVPSFVNLIFNCFHTLGQNATLKIAGGKKPKVSGLRLLANATKDATTFSVDTANAGGGLVSAYITPGCPITINAYRDSSGNSKQSESNTVVSVNDTTRIVTVTDGLDYAYPVQSVGSPYELANPGSSDFTTITVEASARLTVDGAEMSNVVTVDSTQVNNLHLQDWVAIETNQLVDNFTTEFEIAQIIGIHDDGANVVTLSRKLRRTYAVAKQARLTVLQPAFRSTIQGSAPERSAPPDAGTLVHYHEIRYAVDCFLIDCSVPNQGTYGGPGQGFRLHKVYNCWNIRSTMRNPDYFASGEGYGCTTVYGTRSGHIQPYMQGCRHSVVHMASTECYSPDVETSDGRLAEVDFHGLNSVDCWASIRRLSFASRTASSSNGAIVCGNPTHLAGDHDCGVVGGNIGPFGGNVGVYSLRVYPPSRNFTVKDMAFYDIDNLLIHQDIVGQPSLVADGITIMNCIVDGCADRLFDMQGGQNGSTARTWKNLRVINLKATGCVKGSLFKQGDGLILDDVSLKALAPSSSEKYVLNIENVVNLRIHESDFDGFYRGIQLKDTPNHVFNLVTFWNQLETVYRSDLGGSNGEWRLCSYFGFTGITSGSGSTFLDSPQGNIGTPTAAVAVRKAAALIGTRPALNFNEGSNIALTIADNAGTGAVDITIAASGSTGLTTIQEEGVSIAARAKLNFIGAGYTVSDNAGNASSDLTLAATLNVLSGLTAATDKAPYFTSGVAAGLFDLSAYIRTLTGAANAAAAQTVLGLVPGTNVQAFDSDLSAVAGLTSTGIIARTGTGTAAARIITNTSSKVSVTNGDGVAGNPSIDVVEANLTLGSLGGTVPVAKGGTGATTAGGAQTNLGLVIGTNVQAQNANLSALAGLTGAANKLAYFTGAGAMALADIGTFVLSWLTAATSAALARVALLGPPTALTDGTTIATDCALNDRFSVTIAGNRTLSNPTNVVAGAWYSWAVKQNGTGSNTLALGANFILADTETFAMKTAANSTTIISAYAETSTRLLIGFKKYA
jgi:hypothetical protein